MPIRPEEGSKGLERLRADLNAQNEGQIAQLRDRGQLNFDALRALANGLQVKAAEAAQAASELGQWATTTKEGKQGTVLAHLSGEITDPALRQKLELLFHRKPSPQPIDLKLTKRQVTELRNALQRLSYTLTRDSTEAAHRAPDQVSRAVTAQDVYRRLKEGTPTRKAEEARPREREAVVAKGPDPQRGPRQTENEQPGILERWAKMVAQILNPKKTPQPPQRNSTATAATLPKGPPKTASRAAQASKAEGPQTGTSERAGEKGSKSPLRDAIVVLLCSDSSPPPEVLAKYMLQRHDGLALICSHMQDIYRSAELSQVVPEGQVVVGRLSQVRSQTRTGKPSSRTGEAASRVSGAGPSLPDALAEQITHAHSTSRA